MVLSVCIAASEIVPFAKTGGLADVTGALGKYLKKNGHDVRLFMPFYDIIHGGEVDFHPVEFIQNVRIPFEGYSLSFDLLTAKLPGSDADVYFVHCPPLYYRGSVYTSHGDEYLRFAFFCRAVIESCQRMGFSPHIFHCHDWHTAMIPMYLQTLYQWDSLFHRSKSVLTIHNIGYQGIFGRDVCHKIGLSSYLHRFHQDDYHRNQVNFLKHGLLYATWLTAVSRTYAKEIQTPELGAGLDDILRWRSPHLTGIVNGVDYDEWNPEKDRYLPHHYSIHSLEGKRLNKESFLQQLNLAYDPEAPVIGIISRMTYQKGFDILMEIMFDFLAHNNVRFIVIGSGERRYEDFFAAAQTYFPGKVCYYRGYSEEFAHLVQGASDMILLPSRYEPCGLTQIYGLKYGTVPIVRKTGGLADTVQLWNSETMQGTGFVFDHFQSSALSWALWYAMESWKDQEKWKKLMQNGMAQDFSWEKQSQEYIQLFQWLAIS